MIAVHNKTKEKFIVASIIKVPQNEDLYKIEANNRESMLVKKSTIDKYFTIQSAEAGKAVDYFEELDLIKEKVLERVNKINEVLRWTDSRKSLLDSNSPEYQKIDADEQKYKDDLKYYQKVLDNVKDKIVDFQSLQSRVNLEREIDLQELYSQIGLSPEKIDQQDVQITTESPSEESKKAVPETVEKTEEVTEEVEVK